MSLLDEVVIRPHPQSVCNLATLFLAHPELEAEITECIDAGIPYTVIHRTLADRDTPIAYNSLLRHYSSRLCKCPS